MSEDAKQYETRDFKGDITATKANGVEVPVSFTFTYPKGEGVALMQIMKRFSEHISDREVMEYLFDVGDQSFFAAAGVMRDDVTGGYEDGED